MYLTFIIRPVLFCLLAMLLGTGFVTAAELDDASFFVDAFTAYQKKDYLLAIEKTDQLNQLFPDSPLRDVALLLIARSSIKSGDNERAAKAITSFNNEFSDSSLKTTVEEELQSLSARHRKGEPLPPNKQLQTAAQKVRTERLAQERIAAEKAAKESIKVVISVREGGVVSAAGENGSIPVEISNRGKNSEEFIRRQPANHFKVLIF